MVSLCLVFILVPSLVHSDVGGPFFWLWKSGCFRGYFWPQKSSLLSTLINIHDQIDDMAPSSCCTCYCWWVWRIFLLILLKWPRPKLPLHYFSQTWASTLGRCVQWRVKIFTCSRDGLSLGSSRTMELIRSAHSEQKLSDRKKDDQTQAVLNVITIATKKNFQNVLDLSLTDKC